MYRLDLTEQQLLDIAGFIDDLIECHEVELECLQLSDQPTSFAEVLLCEKIDLFESYRKLIWTAYNEQKEEAE